MYDNVLMSGDIVTEYMSQIGFNPYGKGKQRVEIYLREVYSNNSSLPVTFRALDEFKFYISCASDKGIMLLSKNPHSDEVIDSRKVAKVFIPFSNIAAIREAPLADYADTKTASVDEGPIIVDM